MTNPTSALHRTLSPRKNASQSNVTALQGALTAFHGSPPAELQQSTFSTTMGVTGVNRHHFSGPGPIPYSSSPEPPEVGSVKEKIAKFSPSPNLESLRTSSRASRGKLSTPREQSPQQIAAQLAVARSPRPPMKAMETEVAAPRVQSEQNNERNMKIHSPIPIRRNPPSHGPLDEILQGAQQLPVQNSMAHQKPGSPVHPNLAQLEATKPRPNPPAPRRSVPVSSRSTPTPETRLPRQARPDQVLPSSLSSPRNKMAPSILAEERPALPPRRREYPGHMINEQTQQLLVEEKGFQMRPSNSSVTSLSSQSQNPSSSDPLDTFTDIGKEGFSDAIVASSLASTRALQAKKTPPTPPPQRRPRSRSVKDNASDANIPSGLRQTLREQAKSDDEEDPHRRHRHHHHQYRKRIIHKHPHKHHEGDRKRWRSEVTEKERKRYEGVWAANKGLLISPSQVSNQDSQQYASSNKYPPNTLEMVVNLVVRDIWSRSRLPGHVLEQIWNLVDRQKNGLLTREEFVVGMWLIDQQLKGHKLPVVVPDSVWGSVKRVSGISLADLHS